MLFTRGMIESLLGSAFNRECGVSREKAIEILRRGRAIGNESFVSTIRQVILDKSISWATKVGDWTGDYWRKEEENEQLFRDIWNIVSEGQLWPLDEAKVGS